MNAQHPKFSSPDASAIDLLIDHPKFGWIPFTASLGDPEAHGRELFARALAGEFGEVAPYVPPPAPPVPTQFDLDQRRYQQRAVAKDSLIAWMAADNMARVRAGTWSVSDLQQLLVDLAPINAMMQTLSFELAAQAIAALSNPLITAEIKAAWVSKLQEHFYLS